MKASLMLVLTAAVSWKPLMFLNRKQKVEQPKESRQVLYDDFLIIAPQCKSKEPMNLGLTLTIVNGPARESILQTRFVIEEDGHHIHGDFIDLLKVFARREFYWLPERGHPENCLGAVKRSLLNELPRFCFESVERLEDRRLFVGLQLDATSKINR